MPVRQQRLIPGHVCTRGDQLTSVGNGEGEVDVILDVFCIDADLQHGVFF